MAVSPLAKRVNTAFPVISDLTISEQKSAPAHLQLISKKDGSTLGSPNDYLHEGSKAGAGVTMYIIDTGFGPPAGFPAEVPDVSYIPAPEAQDIPRNALRHCFSLSVCVSSTRTKH